MHSEKQDREKDKRRLVLYKVGRRTFVTRGVVRDCGPVYEVDDEVDGRTRIVGKAAIVAIHAYEPLAPRGDPR